MEFCRQRFDARGGLFSPVITLAQGQGFRAFLFPFLALWLLLLPLSGEAQDFLPKGFPLPLDGARELADDKIEVRLSNASRVMQKNAVLDYVIDKYVSFRSLESRYGADSLEKFLLSGAEGVSGEQTGKLLAILLRNTRYEGDRFDVLLEELEEREDVVDLLLNTLSVFKRSPPQRDELYQVFLSLGLRDAARLKAEALPAVLPVKDEFRIFLVERYRNLTAAGKFDAASDTVRLASFLFGEESAADLRALNSKVSKELASLQDKSDADIAPFLRKLRNDPTVGVLLGTFLLNQVHEKSEKAIKQGKPGLALQLLAQVSEEERTPTTLRLLKSSIKRLPSSKINYADPVVFITEVRETIEGLASSNYAVRNDYVRYLRLLLEYFLGKNQEEDFRKIFHFVTSVSKDPSELNDDLRMEMALWYSKQGRNQRAKKVISEMRGGISPGNYVRLLRAGYYPQRVLLTLLVALILLAVLLLRALWPSRSTLADEYYGEEGYRDERATILDEEEEEGDQGRGPRFSLLYTARGLDPKLHEYRLLLNRLELGPEADLKVIKAAYRSKLKQYHPDLQSEGQGNSEKFHQIKDTYEKIIELRKQLGIDQ